MINLLTRVIFSILSLSFLLACNTTNKKAEEVVFKVGEKDFDIVCGFDNSPLKILMYSSYHCAFCQKFYNEVYPELKKEFIDVGKVQLIVKLVELSDDREVIEGLKTAVCINRYGNFEKLHELLLLEPNVVYSSEFHSVVDEFINKDEIIAECLLSGASEQYLNNNLAEFRLIGLTGTPSFLINNKIYKGFYDYSKMKEILVKELENTLR